jgi:hypothetical protein
MKLVCAPGAPVCMRGSSAASNDLGQAEHELAACLIEWVSVIGSYCEDEERVTD